jgi:flagellar biosynthesis protein
MTDAAKSKIAVALEYEFGSRSAPRIVATGKGKIAERILELAAQHGIPTRQDSALAKMLSVVDLESEIPPEAMLAVAEIMAQIFLMNRRLAEAPSSRRPAP